MINTKLFIFQLGVARYELTLYYFSSVINYKHGYKWYIIFLSYLFYFNLVFNSEV